MKNINEDEKPQATGGARPNGKQGFKKKYNNKHTTISIEARNKQTPPVTFSKVLDSVWGHMVLKCTRKRYTR